MSIEIECPSGLRGNIRGLKGKDGRYLSDTQLIRAGVLTEHILANCWEGTSEPAFYKASESGKLDWSKVLLGDRMYILMQIRIAGRGTSDYEFPAQCQVMGCRQKFSWQIDLEDLPVQKLSAALREQFAAENFDLTCVVPGSEELQLLTDDPKTGLALLKPKKLIVPGTGKKITFRLPTGADELAAHRRKQQQKKRETSESNELTEAVLSRTKAIEGMSKEELTAYIEEMDLDAIAKLLDRYDEQDCGVDTTVEIECPACQTLQEITLPFGADFFFQRTKTTVR